MRIPVLSMLVVVVALVASCGRSREVAVKERTDMPLYDLYVENRSSRIVGGWLQFGDITSVAGGNLAPNEVSAHNDLSGGIPALASMKMTVFPVGTKDFRKTKGEKHYAEVPVSPKLPADFYDGVFWFIIDPDYSMRLVILTHEQYNALEARDERPK
jgi:hypothetical protein